MRIIDDTHQGSAPRASIFLHGITGMGKSTFGTVGGCPLVVLTEAKAAANLRKVNPRAIGLFPESLADLNMLFQRLGQPEWLAAKGVDRIVLDSFSDLTYSLPRWIKDAAGQTAVLTKLERGEYGDLGEYSLALVKAIQLTGLPSIIIARSTVKEFGRIRRVVPDGLGKSIDSLPGKLQPTAEAIWIEDAGYVITTTPDECSQRCGLPWVPERFQGTALEFIALIEDTTTAPATATHETATPAATVDTEPATRPTLAAAAPQAQGAPAPANPPAVAARPTQAPPATTGPSAPSSTAAPAGAAHSEAYDAALASLVLAMDKAGWNEDERKTTMAGWEVLGDEALPRLKAFLDSFADGPSAAATLNSLPPHQTQAAPAETADFSDAISHGVTFVTADEADYLLTLLGTFPLDPFMAYLASTKHLIPTDAGDLRLSRVLQASYEHNLKPILKSDTRRHGMLAFIKQNFSATTYTAA